MFLLFYNANIQHDKILSSYFFNYFSSPKIILCVSGRKKSLIFAVFQFICVYSVLIDKFPFQLLLLGDTNRDGARTVSTTQQKPKSL